MVTDGTISVVICDDHARVRGQIRDALQAGGCTVSAEGATAAEAVALTVTHRPDVVLLDIHMPGSGISAAREISAAVPETVVVMLTQSEEDGDLFGSIAAGATGYLLKGGSPQSLPAALRGVLAGEAAMPRALVARILQELQKPSGRVLRRTGAAARLSPREIEVMDLLGSGLSTDQVAQQLFLSPTTVRVHVSSVLRKLRVKDRESAFTALREG